jgi:NAD(P)-dependent dehydrogenase (short-subunit alcohol dehydrogenase family)
MGRRRKLLESLAEEITTSGGLAPLLVTGDVADETACIQCIESTVSAFGRLDVLVNNAGVGFPTDIASCSTDDYHRTIKTNVDGVFFLTRAALKPMRAQKLGHIVMISSDAGAQGNAIAPIYGMSKHALEGFTSCLRMQLESWNKEGIHIKVSNIWPGSVDSNYWGERDVPRHCFMSCEEMAALILQVICTLPSVNITDLRVQQFRFEPRPK